MNRTPFFKELGPLLFGRQKGKVLAVAAKKDRLEDLHGAFAGFIDDGYLMTGQEGTGNRERKLTAEQTFWAFVSQVLDPGSSCRDAVRRLEAWWQWQQWRIDHTISEAAYCKARQRLGKSVLESILNYLAVRLEMNGLKQENLIKGRAIKVVDGSSVSMPDTAELQKRWPQPTGQTPGCGFPVMKVVGVFSLAGGGLEKYATGTLHEHESTLFRQLWGGFGSGDIVLEDRGFCSYGAMSLLQARGVDTIARLHQRRNGDLRQGKSLGPQDRLVVWRKPLQRSPGMLEEDFEQMPDELEVRLIGLDVKVPGWRTRRAVLATTLTDPQKYPAELIREIYLRRWQVELHFAQIKTTLGLEVLRTKSPEMVEKELLIGLIAYNLIRTLMQRAGHAYHVPIEKISFQGTLDCARHYASVIRASAGSPAKQQKLIDEMLASIAQDQLPDRPHRSEPRVKKRRPKNYQLLTAPRHKMKVIPHRETYRKSS